MPEHSIKLLAPPNNKLAKLVSEKLSTSVVPVELNHDSNQEILFSISESIRGQDVYILMPMSPLGINDRVLETLIMLDAARLASAATITAVVPYFPYVRQDKRERPRAPITAKLIADMLVSCGCKHVLTLELHAPQTQGFFNVPVDNLSMEPCIVDYLKENYGTNTSEVVIVSPDAAGAKRASNIADHLHYDVALIHRDREGSRFDNDSRLNLVGNVKKKDCIIIIDIVDTLVTVSKDAELLLEAGALSVIVVAAHGLVSDLTIKILIKSKLEMLVVTNSIVIESKLKKCSKLEILDISGVLAESIRRLHNGESIGLHLETI
ncbi:hypothetical protein TBLA_0G02320 [Henningerozyma blattae CBS 6284]|uniref:ribose-phosphate diphosphokinase n=1 Tax=Henningerozyma blattae (strain ATCC 34711 / CBS 6284 / DSM 70876 / NBRC 10599 / NRRL Y-10934 / UCD 77-7) TaxID=1071380 RepID=I2H720_HENB6|nr:hypothetical protein TBLA_0G02320 [Tetrapisispora blattae CBS 6284]CCH62172.1 hypothetical protein TBLA_0G02320 [Tetrapisispora blattae CBS 6284]